MPSTFYGLATTIISRPEGDEVRIGYVSEDTGANMGLEAPIVLTNFAMGEDRYMTLSQLDTSVQGMWRGVSWPSEYTVVVRPTQEADAVNAESMSAGPHIPLPLDVIAAIHSPEGSLMPTLWAMSEDDGFVATMMLNSDTGLYVRYSGQWHPITDDDVVDGLNVTEVDGAALDMFDQFDRAGQLVHVSAMYKDGQPVDTSTLVTGTAEDETIITASVDTKDVPVLDSEDDLPDAIQAAVSNPDLQWWVERRALGLGLQTDFPWST
jgi:hypothetical protein